ncbi:methionyl-tRNA formyltransferase [Lederbergia panacisoli]|uniref:methionyl-tRNA formyltransferase n=1 Tax=Lederbergia panacisoli TaxID=1255251 RepID=UPI00214CA268|nr:methionyl-tRNA formyltransferase [Lederbergia panacisoli]MCR2820773.1 methionyl-tRNA formyltransferase [Lederbergia panacisoli]
MTKIVFMGTPDFSVPVLRSLIENGFDILAVVTQPDRPVGRKKVLTPPPVKVEAERHGIHVLQPERIRDEQSANEIINLNPDLIVTAAYGQILPTSILEAPKYGCINVHASLLPELRGGAPIHYSILQGKEKTGITIMYMVDKLDAGDIISQVEVPISEDDNVGTLHDKLSIAGSDLLMDTIPKLILGEIKARPQDHDKATFAHNIKREQEKINWQDDGEKIYNQIRGLCPWPVAYTTFQGQVWKVWKAEKITVSAGHRPGEIILMEQDGFIISTGNNIGIRILELQPAGKKKMSAQQFLHGAGNDIHIGSRLDSHDE